ncbi:hypothetical protein K7432_007037 [Basidiobolus ranarum]|uniref:RING-type E3 ubiquitin transferase n=1 Tax=Basidiobolus ranarum TaxID=34480 RepID=A0ABR2WU04_9FUNG
METQLHEERIKQPLSFEDTELKPNFTLPHDLGFSPEDKTQEEGMSPIVAPDSEVCINDPSPIVDSNDTNVQNNTSEPETEACDVASSIQDAQSDAMPTYVDPAFIKERPRTTYSFTGTSLKKQQKSSTNINGESSNTSSTQFDYNDSNSEFSCNICFDAASYPVLTLCGHLYCWPCLHQWLEAQPRNPLCPVCKAGCGKDKVIPVYGRGKEAKDPRTDPNCPKRPAGQRPEPTNNPGEDNNGWAGINMGGVNFAPFFSIGGGFGFLPGLFGFHFTFPPTQQAGNQPVGDPQQAFFTRLLIMIGLTLLTSILFS